MEKSTRKYSEIYGEYVWITKEKHNCLYIDCTRCGKPLKTFYVVTGDETNIEHAYLGQECIKHLN